MTNKNRVPMFSIVLPTYNVAKHIDRCIESCVAQTHEDFEIIVVDDCGIDDSIAKAERWAECDDRIRIIKNPRNLGTFHARSRGVEAAEGEYVLFLDPDDALVPQALDVMAKAITENPADLVLCGVKRLPIDLIFFGSHRVPSNNILMSRIDKTILNTWRFSYGTPGKIYRREVVLKAFKTLDIDHKQRLVYAEDVLIFWAALIQSGSFVGIQEKLYLYYQNESSITRQSTSESSSLKKEQVELISKIMDIKKNKFEKISNGKVVAYSTNKIVNTMLSHSAFNARFENNGNENFYRKSIMLSLRYKLGVKALLVFMIYILSFGKLRS